MIAYVKYAKGNTNELRIISTVGFFLLSQNRNTSIVARIGSTICKKINGPEKLNSLIKMELIFQHFLMLFLIKLIVVKIHMLPKHFISMIKTVNIMANLLP